MKVVIFCDDGCDSLEDQYELYKCVAEAVCSYPKSVEFSIVTVNDRLRDFVLDKKMRHCSKRKEVFLDALDKSGN